MTCYTTMMAQREFGTTAQRNGECLDAYIAQMVLQLNTQMGAVVGTKTGYCIAQMVLQLNGPQDTRSGGPMAREIALNGPTAGQTEAAALCK